MLMAKADSKVMAHREQFNKDVQADRHNRDLQLDDLEAYSGAGQWDETDAKLRKAEDRPLLEQNQLPKYARQTIGDIRESEPSIKIAPDGGGSDKETARIYNGLIRQTQKRAKTTKPVIKAAEAAIISGIGNFRITTKYLRDNPFHQEMCLEAIHNPLAVVWDGDAKEVTRSDAHHVFVREAVTREQFKRKYKGATMDDFSSDDTDQSQSTALYNWASKDTVTVAEYFEVTSEKAPYALLQDGAVVRLDRLPARIKHNTDANVLFDVMSQQSMQITDVKDADARKVIWKKMSGWEVLEERDWLTPDIPVIAVVGEQIHFHDRTVRVSLIRYAKAAQKIYNYGVNAQLEMAMNAPKAPYLLGTSQLPEGKAALQMWAEANKGNKPYLLWNDSKSKIKPSREPGPPLSPALQGIIAQASEDLKGTTGIYDAALGMRSNETSGVAIANRQREADVGTNLFADNLEASLTHAGRIMVDLIPRIYDSERILRISGEDGSDEEVEINKQRIEGGQPMITNDLTVGRYDMAVNIGPSATTKRQEALQGMERLLGGNPQLLPQVLDLIVEQMDFPGADQFVTRLRKMLPPGTLEGDDEEKTPQQQQAEQAAAQEQQDAAALQKAGMEATVQKQFADAAKTEAEAEKIQIEAQSEAMQMMLDSGMFDERLGMLISQAVQAATAPPQVPTAAP